MRDIDPIRREIAGLVAEIRRLRAENARWRDNAHQWRRLYQEITEATDIGHNVRSVHIRAESSFRELIERGER